MSVKCDDCENKSEEFINEDMVVYHFTCPGRVENILKNGLIPKSNPTINQSRSRSLYFLSSRSSTKLWMKIMCLLWFVCKTQPILLQIDNSSRSYSIRRVFREHFNNTVPTATDELHTHDSIYPHHIKVVNVLPWPLRNINGADHEDCLYLYNHNKYTNHLLV